MKAIHLIQVMTILVSFIRLTNDQAALPARPSVKFTKPIGVDSATTENISIGAGIDESANWLINDETSRWTVEEVESLLRVLQNTSKTLETFGIDGAAMLSGYRFRRQSGDYVGDVEGRMGIIDHNKGEITLSDKAFTVQHSFAIYHELGHAVDYLLNREFSAGFHRYTGKSENNEVGKQWQTAENYWLRQQSRDDPEEAAADAFAVLVMSQAGLRRPIFANQPVTTDYDGISASAALALKTAD